MGQLWIAAQVSVHVLTTMYVIILCHAGYSKVLIYESMLICVQIRLEDKLMAMVTICTVRTYGSILVIILLSHCI